MDVRLVKDACETAIKIIEASEYSKPTPKELLRRFFEETFIRLTQGGHVENVMFEQSELISLVKTGKYSNAQAKKFKSDHYEEAKLFLSNIQHLFEKFRVELVETTSKGGAGNKKFHLLRFSNSGEGKEEVKFKRLAYDIEYSAVALPNPRMITKPFLSFELTGWRLKLYWFIPLFTLLLGYALFFSAAFSLGNIQILALAIFATAVFLLWAAVAPFYEANLKRIAMAPDWMLRWGQQSAQLESVKLEKTRQNGRHYRKLECVVYEGVCPICGNKIFIEKGKSLFKGRLIGVCDESPREHIFSFDHISKTGTKLS